MRLEPWILLLLARENLHGYELTTRLQKADGAPAADTGNVYRTLRRLEKQNIVVSAWEAGNRAGPARRVYKLTPTGEAALAMWAAHIGAAHRSLGGFLRQYQGRTRERERQAKDASTGLRREAGRQP
jgi:PadR family transcriptional regulator PadR